MRYYHLLFVLLACALVACEPKPEPKPSDGMRHDSLTATYDLFCNPERGFHVFQEFSGAVPNPISASVVNTIYKNGNSLILTNYYLKSFRDRPISDAYLDGVRTNMQTLRECGCKCILRFAYTGTDAYTTAAYASNYDDPREAPVEIILQHIGQIKPILQEYADVIFTMEAGFVGVWGEWYYTTNFKMNPRTTEEYADYKRVLDALLDALPAERQICVRTPTFKMKCYGWELSDTLTRAEAYQNTPKARLASHDDAFMANSSDMGTFKSPTERQYWEAETKYTVYGGESNQPSSYSNCDNSIAQMQAMHMSYLNSSYHKTVIARWQSGGCLEDMRRLLGYRLVGKDVATTKSPKVDEELKVVITLENEGFSAPKNPRDVRVLLINKNNAKDIATVTPDCDPRFWGPEGEHKINATFIPKKAGEYSIYLYLPDPMPTLAANPRFAIRLANKDCWNAETGYNYLTTVTVE